MKVFTDYSEETAHLLRVWFRSWSRRGWTPRLIFQKSVSPGRSVKVSPFIINFSFKGGNPLPIVQYKAPGWRRAALVRFPKGSTEDTVLECGRSLD